jgi:K(+)-stimulated pyrophosphate-energized sodium pump
MDVNLLAVLGCGAAAIIYVIVVGSYVLGLSPGNERMQEIALAIEQGANAFMKRQYTSVALVGVGLFIIIGSLLPKDGWVTAAGFAVGATLSSLAGIFGMKVSVKANVRTAEAARGGLAKALDVAFKGGSVTGLLVVGLGLIGVAGFYMATKNVNALVGLGFGASLVSVFARLGGGIYTKAADVGADLVGKVEAGIPEDDPRNPAVIADNVGDNVGDCAGMAADLFETYAVTAVATMLLASQQFKEQIAAGRAEILYYPLILGGASIITSIVGCFFVRLGKNNNIMGALYNGLVWSAILAGVAFWFVTDKYMGGLQYTTLNLWSAAMVGLVVTGAIVVITEYYTSTSFAPVKYIAKASETGSATNIIAGLAVSLKATAFPVIAIVIGIIVSFALCGVFGVATPMDRLPTTPVVSLKCPSFPKKFAKLPIRLMPWVIPQRLSRRVTLSALPDSQRSFFSAPTRKN